MLRLNLAPPVCRSCSEKRIAAPNKRTCQVCVERRAHNRQEKKRRGICAVCPKATEKDHSYCRDCLDKRKLKSELAPTSLCNQCRRVPPVANRGLCKSCHKKVRDRRAQRVSDGICLLCLSKLTAERRAKGNRNCGRCARWEKARHRKAAAKLAKTGRCASHPKRAVAPGQNTRCEECRTDKRKYLKERSDARKAAGLCTWCGKAPAEGDSPYCDYHKKRAKAQRQRSRDRAALRYKN